MWFESLTSEFSTLSITLIAKTQLLTFDQLLCEESKVLGIILQASFNIEDLMVAFSNWW